jgi:glycosyltransferase involved in cell wall biosynthesis
LILSNFNDASLSRIINSHSASPEIKLILLEDQSIGYYILKGLESSRGEILTFLDDDDVYEKTRLEEIAKIFTENKNVVYFRNATQLMDTEGNEIRGAAMNKHCRSGAYSLKEISKRGISDLQWGASTIALRSYILERYKEFLPMIDNAQDVWMFYLSMAERMLMYLDCQILSRNRIHPNRLSTRHNYLARGYQDTAPLLNIIDDKEVLDELQKARARMLFLSIIRGYAVPIRELFEQMIFYIKHLQRNVRDIQTLVYCASILFIYFPLRKRSLWAFSKLGAFIP